MTKTTFDSFAESVAQAEFNLRAADALATNMAIVLIGRMRAISKPVLRDMKKELSKFNTSKMKWNDDKNPDYRQKSKVYNHFILHAAKGTGASVCKPKAGIKSKCRK